MEWQKRRLIDFWLLAGIIGLWYYWLFLYRSELLTGKAIKSYLWLIQRNILSVLLFGIALIIAFLFLRRKRWGIGIAIVVITAMIGYWAYGPDFPKIPPLNPPRTLWRQTPSRIPVVLVISYNHQRELLPFHFLKVQEWIYRQNIRLRKEVIQHLCEQIQKALIELAREAGEDTQLFEKCLKLALKYVATISSEPHLPLCAEKRYEHVTGQICWVFGFVRLRQERVGSSSFLRLYPLIEPWVAVRLRFPQKAWMTYLAIEPENVFRRLLLTLAIVLGYGIFLKILRYAFDRWY